MGKCDRLEKHYTHDGKHDNRTESERCAGKRHGGLDQIAKPGIRADEFRSRNFMNCCLGIGKYSRTWRLAQREGQKDVGPAGWLRLTRGVSTCGYDESDIPRHPNLQFCLMGADAG